MRIHFALLAMAAAAAAQPVIAQPVTPTIADPAKRALAERVAGSMWPDGTYGRMIDSMFGGKDGLTDMFLDMRPGDLMGALAETMVGDGKVKPDVREGPDTSPTFREIFSAEDPHFEERMRITVKVVGDEVRRIARPIEPKFRAGLAKSIERRFNREQLEPIARFLETEPGRAFAAQSMTLFIDKDVMLALVQSLPAVIKEMPAAFKKVQAATAHLPKPPKKADADEKSEEESPPDSD